MSFHDYLRAEGEVTERSHAEYRTELGAFAELADLYERLATAITVAERRAIIPAELFLVVANGMFGSGAQMLRTRAADALALTRRAIEATATAYRIWKNPELADVFVNAYPRHNQIGHPNQWLPTREYRNQFSSRKLFDQPGETFAALKAYYGLTSAMASHAGVGALASHRNGPLQRVAPFLGGEPRDIIGNWYMLLTAYMEIFKVFVRMLRGNSRPEVIDVLVQEFLAWRDRTAAIMGSRAPWMEHAAHSVRQGSIDI